MVGRRRQILDRFDALGLAHLQSWQTRIHGDYHLGQVLKVGSDLVILDFEGEPARPLAGRRAKQSPLKDVAGMLRSFSYAVYMSLINYAAAHPESMARLEPWARFWEHTVSAEFLRAYRKTTREKGLLHVDEADFRRPLDVFLIEKALYEVMYELNARLAWVRIPLMGLLSLTGPVGAPAWPARSPGTDLDRSSAGHRQDRP